MKFIDKVLSEKEMRDIKKRFGEYVKLTVDLGKEWIVAGCELHADGEKILLEKGCKQENIWGGGISLKDKIIDTTAVLNLRPSLGNDGMEILDPKTRERFVSIVKKIFGKLWR